MNKLFAILMFYTTLLNAQVGIGTTSPHSSSILDVNSTTSGFLPPRLTSVERDAIANPSQGLIVFNTDTQCLDVYNATLGVWKSNCGDKAPSTAIYTPNCSGISVQGTYL